MDFSADPSDKEAFNRYVEEFKKKFGETYSEKKTLYLMKDSLVTMKVY